LPEAGTLDLLFVNSEGLPIAAEVKLTRNHEARRDVIAQIIDYLSSLKDLTVNQLDQLVQGKLDKVLHEFTGEADDEDAESERVWKATEEKLRAGKARLVVVLDMAPAPPLERIFRFLASNSNLDVRLVTVERYSAHKIGEVLVPRTVVNSATGGLATPPDEVELLAAFDAFKALGLPDLKFWENGLKARTVRPIEWRNGQGIFPRSTFYRLKRDRAHILVILKIDPGLSPTLLEPFNGQLIANDTTVAWRNRKLIARFPLAAPAPTIAQTMVCLISQTRGPLTEALQTLV